MTARSTTWAIPDRPPNVRIVSVNGQLVANRARWGISYCVVFDDVGGLSMLFPLNFNDIERCRGTLVI